MQKNVQLTTKSVVEEKEDLVRARNVPRGFGSRTHAKPILCLIRS
jgi:hypothetical protein